MYVAIDKDGNRIHASDAKITENYFCPVCKKEVILRRGDINVAHFAHKSNECEDNWHYDMSEWHYSMQERFPKEQREVVVKRNGITHRADILQGKQLIEFQHSPISLEEIQERNNFYNAAGYNVAWVFDFREQYDSGAIFPVDDESFTMLKYKWSNPKRFLRCFPKPKEYIKDLVLFFYWIEEDGYEHFNKVIWSTGDYDPDFKRFGILNYDIVTSDNRDLNSSLYVNDFFTTKKDMLNECLSTLHCRYIIKYAGIEGHRENEYICPRTNVFGLFKPYGELVCSHCRYCAAIQERKNGFLSFCCYPNQVNEVIDVHPEYECSHVPVF